MINAKRARYTLISIVVALFLSSIIITVYTGIGLEVAVIDNALDSLQVGYNLIPFSYASNPLILLSKLFDAGIFPILTVILAAWFFDFINNINLRERMILSKLKRIRDHIIIAPYNSFAKSLMQELKNKGMEYVVIVENRRELVQLYRENELAIDGDIRSIETFEIVNINRAKCLIACSKDDIQNALITITAKTANPHIRIISRVNKDENAERLKKAGAHRIIIPETSAGNDVGNELAKRMTIKRGLKKA